jgi:V/A-type H+-transporting ATPase subunit E
MSLESVLDEIHKKGHQEVAQIISAGQREADSIIAEAKTKLKSIEEAKHKVTADKIKQLRIQELSIAELDAKKNILNMQKELLERLRSQTLTKLQELPDDKNQQYLKKLIERAKTEFPSGKIYCNAKDESFVKSNSPFQFGGTIDCSGGVLVENDDGSINMDFRFENILDEAWKDVMKEVSKLLFKPGERSVQ